MKTTAKVELPTGVTLGSLPALLDREHDRATVDAVIKGVSKSDTGHSIVVEIELDIDVRIEINSSHDPDPKKRGAMVGLASNEKSAL